MDFSTEMNIIAKTDFTKGFTSFHIQWPVKTIEKDTFKNSAEFETIVKYGNKERSFRWCLGVDGEENWYGLRLRDTEIDVVPVIIRGALISRIKDKKVFVQDENVCIFESVDKFNDGYGFDVEPGKIVGADIMMHLWLDIPNVVVEWPIDTEKDFFGTKPLVEVKSFAETSKSSITSSFTQLYFSCVGEQEPLLSDVQLIVDNRNDRKNENAEGSDENSDGKIDHVALQIDTEIIEKFSCHRNILSIRSSIFRNMFADNKWKEGQEDDNDNGIPTVKIEDVGGEAMRVLLKYIYTGILPDVSDSTPQQLFNIIYGADKYDLGDLKNWCVSDLIWEWVGDKQRVKQLEFAELHNLDQLKAVCVTQLSVGLEAFSDSLIPCAVAAEVNNRKLFQEEIRVEDEEEEE